MAKKRIKPTATVVDEDDGAEPKQKLLADGEWEPEIPEDLQDLAIDYHQKQAKKKKAAGAENVAKEACLVKMREVGITKISLPNGGYLQIENHDKLVIKKKEKPVGGSDDE